VRPRRPARCSPLLFPPAGASLLPFLIGVPRITDTRFLSDGPIPVLEFARPFHLPRSIGFFPRGFPMRSSHVLDGRLPAFSGTAHSVDPRLTAPSQPFFEHFFRSLARKRVCSTGQRPPSSSSCLQNLSAIRSFLLPLPPAVGSWNEPQKPATLSQEVLPVFSDANNRS